MFTEAEIRLLLELIKDKYCPRGGYADDPLVGGLQAKLSIHLEMASRRSLNALPDGPKGSQ